MTHERADGPTAQREPFWRLLRPRDWAAVIALMLAGTVGLHLLRTLVQELPPQTRPLGDGLLLVLATLVGALLTYTILRRGLLAQGELAESLSALARQQLADSRDLLSAVRTWVADAYALGHREGRAEIEALLDIAERRNAQLAAQLDAGRLQLDATDMLILELLSEDPTTTDEEIARHPRVQCDRTAVTRRRNRLAAAGYAVAQKRRGQRPAR